MNFPKAKELYFLTSAKEQWKNKYRPSEKKRIIESMKKRANLGLQFYHYTLDYGLTASEDQKIWLNELCSEFIKELQDNGYKIETFYRTDGIYYCSYPKFLKSIEIYWGE